MEAMALYRPALPAFSFLPLSGVLVNIYMRIKGTWYLAGTHENKNINICTYQNFPLYGKYAHSQFLRSWQCTFRLFFCCFKLFKLTRYRVCIKGRSSHIAVMTASDSWKNHVGMTALVRIVDMINGKQQEGCVPLMWKAALWSALSVQ